MGHNIGYKAIIIFFAIGSYSYGQGKDFGKRVDYTQYAASGAEGALSELLVKNLGKPTHPHDVDQIKGSPYFEELFQRGLVFYDHKLIDTLFMRYNAYQDEIQVKKAQIQGEPFQALLKNSAVSCNLNHDEIEYLDFKDGKDKIQKSYFFVLVKGKKYDLYSRKQKKLRPGRKSSNSLARSIDPLFVDEIGYYVSTPENQFLVQLPERRKKILDLFESKDKDSVAMAIKQMRFNASNQDQIVEIFRNLNEN